MADDRIEIVWESDDRAALEDSLAHLQQDDPEAKLELRPQPGIMSAAIIIAGTIAVLAISREVQRWTCQLQKPGFKFDATHARPKLIADPEVPNGTILIIKSDHSVEQLDVCGGIPAERIADALAAAAGGLKDAIAGDGDGEGGDGEGGNGESGGAGEGEAAGEGNDETRGTA